MLTFNSYALNNTYFALPPFLQQDTYSNLYLILDYSGSMDRWAYKNRYAARYDYVYDPSSSSYDPNKTYYGYFKPDATYDCMNDSDNIYCTDYDEYWYITDTPITGDLRTGNELNYMLMERVDLLRYVLTGGGDFNDPSCKSNGQTCSIYDNQTACVSNPLCRWKTNKHYCKAKGWTSCSDKYHDNTSCESNELCEWYDGSFIVTEGGERIKSEDLSNYDPITGKANGILQNIEAKKTRPRIGVIIYGSHIKESIEPSYDYFDVISAINSEIAYGATATKESIEEAYDYFTSTDAYTFGTGGNTITIPCAKNFTLLMSDGKWNSGGDPQPLIDSMWKGGKADLMDNGTLDGNQKVETYSMAMFLDNSSGGFRAMKHFGVFGGYEDYDNNSLPCNYTTDYLITSLSYTFPSSCSEWDKDNDGKPDNFFTGENPQEFKRALEDVFKKILKNVSSSTSVAVLTDKKKEGSVMAQAVFYPEYRGVTWVGKLFLYWYLNSKKAQNIREDNVDQFRLNTCGADGGDHILKFSYNDNENRLEIETHGSTCRGNDNGTVIDTYYQLEDIASLIEESNYLDTQFDNSSSTYGRIIYTNCDADDDKEVLNTCSSSSYFGNDLGCLPDNASLIDFTYGSYVSGCRNRTDNDNTKRILGDIVYSTPQIVDYDNLTLVFISANDGMLHAFRIGKTVKTRMENITSILQNDLQDNGTDLIGQEEWAFIPKNALPYLRFRAQPGFDHLYINDLTPYIFNAGDKKILIGGMRMGGGVSDNASDTVLPPTDTCPDMDNDSCIGRSSYYALDITNPLEPELLWEFNHKDLRYTYSGPAIIRNNNGYYVMFLSGMSNYKAETTQNIEVFILKLDSDFKLASNYLSVINAANEPDFASMNNSFGGRLFTQGIDYNKDGKTDAVFFGINRYTTAWTGDIFVIKPTDDEPVDTSNNVNWSITKVMSNLGGAVNSKITYMDCFNMPYIYFGTGRWFYKTDDLGQNSNDFEYLFGVSIKDCLENNNCSINSAVNVASSCTELQNNKNLYAWKIPLDPKNNTLGFGKERNISDVGVMPWANTVMYSTMQPSSNPCTMGGRSRIWELNCATGKSIWDDTCSGYVVNTSSVSCGYLQTSTSAINQICKNDTNPPALPEGEDQPDDQPLHVPRPEGTSKWYTGVTPETPPIIPPPATSGYTGRILLWLEK